MCPVFDVNFEDTPERPEPVEPGMYALLITAAPEVQPTKDQKSTKLVVSFQITTEGPMQGRTLSDHIGLKEVSNPKSLAAIRLKKLATSAGVDVGGGRLDTVELAGKTVRAVVARRQYKDEDTQEQREAAGIKEYLPPPEG